MKPRNHTLALVAKNDPQRYRIRTREGERRKLVLSRSRRNRTVHREMASF